MTESGRVYNRHSRSNENGSCRDKKEEWSCGQDARSTFAAASIVGQDVRWFVEKHPGPRIRAHIHSCAGVVETEFPPFYTTVLEQEIAAGRLAGIQHAIHALHEEFTAVATLLAASRNA